jgi:hypothetical protein
MTYQPMETMMKREHLPGETSASPFGATAKWTPDRNPSPLRLARGHHGLLVCPDSASMILRPLSGS